MFSNVISHRPPLLNLIRNVCLFQHSPKFLNSPHGDYSIFLLKIIYGYLEAVALMARIVRMSDLVLNKLDLANPGRFLAQHGQFGATINFKNT